MKSINWLCLIIGLVFFTLFSCGKKGPTTTETSYSDGILITNRGALFDPVGTISHFNRESGSFANRLYQRVNADTLFGSIQSIATHKSKAYIVMNDPDRIEVVNLRDFVWERTIEGLTDPKHVLPVSLSKLYISQWGADGLSGTVQIYSLNSNSVIDSIPTGRGASHMVQSGNNVYVANSGGILSDSTVAIINTSTDAIVSHVDVGINPTHLKVDKNNAVWVLTKGIIYNNQPNVDGKLSKIVDGSVTYQHDLVAGAANLDINGEMDLLYYVMNGWTYSHDINATSINTTPFIQKYFWGIGVDPETDDVWGTDPMNFFVPGTIYRYDKTGDEIDTYGAGLVPEKFLFQ